MSEEEVPVERTGPIGRAVRALFAVGLLLFLSWPVSRLPTYHDPATVRELMFWMVSLVSVGSLPYVLDVGLGWGAGRQVQLTVLGMVGPLAGLDLVLFDVVWAKPLAWYAFGVQAWVLGTLALGYLLAALLATPGCELRAFADLAARLSEKRPPAEFCPAGLDGLDAWEAKRR